MIDVAAPGMEKNDFTLKVENDVLTVKAEKKSESSDKDVHFTRREFGYNVFNRSFDLPDTVNSEKIDAKYENGILSIVLPKLDEAKSKPERLIKIA